VADEPIHDLVCSEIWGGNEPVDASIALPGITGAITSQPSGGGQGGDIYYLSACSFGLTARACLADVAGHGEAVSQVSAWLHEIMRATMNRHDPAHIFDEMNQRAVERGFDAIATAVALSYDAAKGKLTYCYAGHPPALFCKRAKGDCSPLAREQGNTEGPTNVVLGVTEAARYEVDIVQLEPGDRIVIYTDGVTEARDGDGHPFGEARLAKLLSATAEASPEAVLSELRTALRAHASPRRDQDDITVVVLDIGPRIRGRPIWRLICSHLRKWRQRSCPLVGRVVRR